MIELELKAVVEDWDAAVHRLLNAGATEEFKGRLLDRRMDFVDRRLSGRDEMCRIRVYVHVDGSERASLEWKGPTSTAGGYKRREEIDVGAADPRALMTILQNIGLRVTRAIDRDIHQFQALGATVRLERYQTMDSLVEVEGDPEAIERAIEALGIPRASFTADVLATFASRFTARTGQVAVTGPSGVAADCFDA